MQVTLLALELLLLSFHRANYVILMFLPIAWYLLELVLPNLSTFNQSTLLARFQEVLFKAYFQI